MSLSVWSSPLDKTLVSLSQDQTVTKQGQVLFEQICASCHAKDLSGASGFNLKDGEWIHGNQASDILNNVKNGFMKAGMPGFGAMFSEEQLQSIVAYVISKREGFVGLTYKLYQLNDENDKQITQEKLIKSGDLAKNLADFSIPEIKHYFIEFEGDFYAPKELDTQIWLEWGFPHEANFYIDGGLVERGGEPWYPTWRLKRGKQHLKITYRSGKTKQNQRNLVMLGTNLDMTIKLFAVSTRAKSILDDKKYELKTQGKTIVQRKRMHQLPSYTISVGLPSKINFGFNTRTCGIVALWQGEMMNVGPNVSGRGEDPSLALGEYVFNAPQRLGPALKNDKSCRYKGYKLRQNEPEFFYQVDDVSYSILAKSSHADKITFNYTISFSNSDSSNNAKALNFILPKAANLTWYSAKKELTAESDWVTPNHHGQFSLSATVQR